MPVPLIFRIFWIAPMLGGALLIFSTWGDIQTADSSAQWMRIDGEIVEIAQGRSGWFGGGMWGTYAWEYGGRRYTGSEVDCCSSRNWQDAVETVLRADGRNGSSDSASGPAAIGPGTRLDVYVDPKDPAKAVLITGAFMGCYVPILAGFGLIAAGMWIRKRIMADDVGSASRGM